MASFTKMSFVISDKVEDTDDSDWLSKSDPDLLQSDASNFSEGNDMLKQNEEGVAIRHFSVQHLNFQICDGRLYLESEDSIVPLQDGDCIQTQEHNLQVVLHDQGSEEMGGQAAAFDGFPQAASMEPQWQSKDVINADTMPEGFDFFNSPSNDMTSMSSQLAEPSNFHDQIPANPLGNSLDDPLSFLEQNQSQGMNAQPQYWPALSSLDQQPSAMSNGSDFFGNEFADSTSAPDNFGPENFGLEAQPQQENFQPQLQTATPLDNFDGLSSFGQPAMLENHSQDGLSSLPSASPRISNESPGIGSGIEDYQNYDVEGANYSVASSRPSGGGWMDKLKRLTNRLIN